MRLLTHLLQLLRNKYGKQLQLMQSWKFESLKGKRYTLQSSDPMHPGKKGSITTITSPKRSSGSARVFVYSVFGGVLNRVYGILQLKYGYSVYHFLWISGIKYSKLRLFLGIFGGIWGILGYFVDFSSGILVFHYPPWPTLAHAYMKLFIFVTRGHCT